MEDFSSPSPLPSASVLDRELPWGRHDVTVRPTAGTIPLDALEVLGPSAEAVLSVHP
jgi:hypothetical protein